jgi:hypothetical protein
MPTNFLFSLNPLVLSQRLGLGKGGLRMAPEENLLEVLQVSHYSCLSKTAYCLKATKSEI